MQNDLTAPLLPVPPILNVAASVGEVVTIHLESVALDWLRVLMMLKLTIEVELEPLELEEIRLLLLDELS